MGTSCPGRVKLCGSTLSDLKFMLMLKLPAIFFREAVTGESVFSVLLMLLYCMSATVLLLNWRLRASKFFLSGDTEPYLSCLTGISC